MAKGGEGKVWEGKAREIGNGKRMVGPMAIPAEALWRTAEAVAVVAAATIGACVLNVVSSKTS